MRRRCCSSTAAIGRPRAQRDLCAFRRRPWRIGITGADRYTLAPEPTSIDRRRITGIDFLASSLPDLAVRRQRDRRHRYGSAAGISPRWRFASECTGGDGDQTATTTRTESAPRYLQRSSRPGSEAPPPQSSDEQEGAANRVRWCLDRANCRSCQQTADFAGHARSSDWHGDLTGRSRRRHFPYERVVSPEGRITTPDPQLLIGLAT